MRSHPPTLIKVATRTLSEECALAPGERILVATSGGGDSQALLHVLSILAPKLRVTLVAHGVDHGLRTEAAAELDLAAELSERLGVPFARTTVDVGKGGNLQARARDARRAALEDAARSTNASRIATAHHADDRAETLLIRLLHGATPPGLGVLRPADGLLIRPLVRARKADIVRHLARHDILFATDPSNEDRRFLRVRVRLELLPLLQDLSPAIVAHLTALADDLVAGAPPGVLDEAGRPIALRRSHVHELRRALALGQPARIRLSGDRDIVVDPKAREVRVSCAGTPPRTGKGLPTVGVASGPSERDREKKGGAKSTKSG